MMQPINGCKLLDVEIEALALEGLSPKPAAVPPYAGLLLLKIDGLIEPGAAPDDDDVVGIGVAVIGDVVDDDVEDADVGKMQEPVLGFTFVVTAVPPKSQLVCTGFF